MKRIRIALIIMVVLVAAALGTFFIFNSAAEKNKKEAADEQAKLVIFDFDSEAVNSIKIHNESGDYEMQYSVSDGWLPVNDIDFDLNESMLTSICTNMSSLTAQKIIDYNDMSKFGFNDPIIITVKSNEKDYTLKVGDVSPTNDGYYVMKEGSDSIYLIDSFTGLILTAIKDNLKSEYMADFLPANVEAFTLWRGGESDENVLFSLKIDESGTWYMDKPYENHTVYTTSVDTFINDCIRDKIYSFGPENCPESDYAKYGFDDPEFVLEISGHGKHVKVIFGDLFNDNTEMYGLLADNGQVVTFELQKLSTLSYTTADLMSKEIYQNELNKIKNVIVSMPDDTADIEIDTAQSKYKVNGTDIDIEDDKLNTVFFDFLASFNNANFESIDKDAEPSGEAEVTVRYTLSDGTETTVEYIPVPGEDSNKYWAMINGEYTGFIVRKKVVAAISTTFEALKSFM
ncbi:MAG: DUF4340 domain-containing protein [Clostridium sp.]|nr:DUF4340 domain-containing protein [Clostridium sp.]MCM1547281.1 DUF4340 domain-containing protein [Ruminococcus sp.]